MANDIGSGIAAQAAGNMRRNAGTFTTRDGVEIYFKDWGRGRPVVFCHGWPLGADSWESQMFHMANNGMRAVAHDRRGHMRSSQPWDGNDMDHYADDLAQLIELLDLDDVFLIGFRPAAARWRAMSAATVPAASPGWP